MIVYAWGYCSQVVIYTERPLFISSFRGAQCFHLRMNNTETFDWKVELEMRLEDTQII